MNRIESETLSTAALFDLGADWSDTGGLRVATIGRPRAPVKVLAFMGLRACVEPIEVRRFALLADEWDARISFVDTPGCGYGGAGLTHRERIALCRGDFTLVARRMVHAAKRHDENIGRRAVMLVGYSLGASLAAAAAADPGLIPVNHMIAVEPVAIDRHNPLRLMHSARSEDRVLAGYLANNAGCLGANTPGSGHRGAVAPYSRADVALLGYALSRGRLIRDLLRANRVQCFPVQIVHGTDSILTPSEEAERLTSACRRAAIDVYDVPVAGHHALWQSLPHVAEVARLTRKRWAF
jgi:pimeloyl-ACP methyl ester carboxylesterase